MHMPIAPERDERIEVEFVLSKKPIALEIVWWVKLRPIWPSPVRGIVWRADAGQQQKLDVEQLEGAQDHEVGRLLPAFAGTVHVGDAGRPLAGCGRG